MQTTTRGGKLSAFNQLVSQYQDQAYTLAWRFLGDERQAEEALHSAVMDVYRHAGPLTGPAFRSTLFQTLARRLLGAPQANPAHCPGWSTGVNHASPNLTALDPPCRLVVILIDCLRMTYPEAAQVSGLALPQIRACLAQARVCLAALNQAEQAL